MQKFLTYFRKKVYLCYKSSRAGGEGGGGLSGIISHCYPYFNRVLSPDLRFRTQGDERFCIADREVVAALEF